VCRPRIDGTEYWCCNGKCQTTWERNSDAANWVAEGGDCPAATDCKLCHPSLTCVSQKCTLVTPAPTPVKVGPLCSCTENTDCASGNCEDSMCQRPAGQFNTEPCTHAATPNAVCRSNDCTDDVCVGKAKDATCTSFHECASPQVCRIPQGETERMCTALCATGDDDCCRNPGANTDCADKTAICVASHPDPDTDKTNVCLTPIANGDHCTGAQCVEGSSCAHKCDATECETAQADKVCIADRSQSLGDVCSQSNWYTCPTGSQCWNSVYPAGTDPKCLAYNALAEDEGCEHTLQCATTHYCMANECKPRIAADADCSPGEVCVDGHSCLAKEGESAKCWKINLAVGEDCFADGMCAGFASHNGNHVACDTEGSGATNKCMDYLGTSCTEDSKCSPEREGNPSFRLSLRCNCEDTCERNTVAPNCAEEMNAWQWVTPWGPASASAQFSFPQDISAVGRSTTSATAHETAAVRYFCCAAQLPGGSCNTFLTTHRVNCAEGVWSATRVQPTCSDGTWENQWENCQNADDTPGSSPAAVSSPMSMVALAALSFVALRM